MDISGSLDISGINVYNKFTQLDNSLNNNLIKNYSDASFNDVDISGILDLSTNNAKLKIANIDKFNLLDVGCLYYDNSGNVKIKLNQIIN